MTATCGPWVAALIEARPHQGRRCFGKTPMQTWRGHSGLPHHANPAGLNFRKRYGNVVALEKHCAGIGLLLAGDRTDGYFAAAHIHLSRKQ